jgi:hypothetical protein
VFAHHLLDEANNRASKLKSTIPIVKQFGTSSQDLHKTPNHWQTTTITYPHSPMNKMVYQLQSRNIRYHNKVSMSFSDWLSYD